MKKIYLMAIAIGAFAFTSNAQFTDNFDSYSQGPLFNSLWTTWDGNDDGAQNIEVSAAQSLSAPFSGFIGPGAATGGPQDAILDFGGVASNGSGIWTAQWMMYIPTGNSGYFNIQGNVTPNANANLQFLSGDIYFNEANGTPGEGDDDNGGGTFTFPHDAWFLVKIVCDTDAQTYSLQVDSTEIPAVDYNAASDGFAGIDFFAAEPETTYYIDDVQLAQGLLGVDDFSADNFSVYPNPVRDILNIQTTKTVESVVIYDVLGKVVVSTQPDAISPRIDMSELSSGAYMVNVTIDGASKTVKVIK